MTKSTVTVVGVHVRREDMLNNPLGFRVAPKDYLENAVQFYQRQYGSLLFIVASDDISWCKKHMPKNTSVVYINNKPEIDMAVLSECDHSIMTVGTFGW